MKSVKITLILLLAVAGFIEAGPQLDGTMEDVNSASPEVYPASEEGPPEDDPATEEFSSSEIADQSKSRTRRDAFGDCLYACTKKGWFSMGFCSRQCKKIHTK